MRALQRTEIIHLTFIHINIHKYPAVDFFFLHAVQEKMSSCVFFSALLTLPLAVGWELLGDREKVQTVCVGKEFRLPVDSTSRIVTFTPDSEGPRRVLLEKTTIKDPRFEWTRDKTLVLKEVALSDQGLYANKLSIGFTYETVRLVVSECIRPYHKNYGENFQHSIPENGSLLEFSPRGAPSEAMPIVLWNRTDPGAGRGRLLHGGKVWVAEKVTQADQGNYTVRDNNGKTLSRSVLSVHEHSFKVTRFTKESLTLPLFLPVPHTHLIFTPSRYPDESSLGPFDPKPPRGPVQLIREGHIIDHDMRYRDIIALNRNGANNEVIITRLTSRHDGLYEIKDSNGNLVSTTFLQVIEKKESKWRVLLKSVSVPGGMFVSLTGFFLFLKRYPCCSISRIISGLRTNRPPPANPPGVNIQAQSCAEPSGYYGQYNHQPGTPRKWTPRASPAHSGYTPVMAGSPRAVNQHGARVTAQSSPSHNLANKWDNSNEEDRRISFSVPGASDCLQSSEDCIQFQIAKEGDNKRWSISQEFFSKLPLDMETSESCSVYTSEKMNFASSS